MDQVLSYAAIRTNMELEILDRTSIEIAWRRDMVPSAEAYMVHQIKMSGRDTISEAEGIHRIHSELNQAGTLSGGYNTLGFDDEMLRFSFYRCLLPPYTHQYQNECGRFDILPMVLFYYLYSEDTLVWPKIDGKPSFKLEAINDENKWVSGRAHEAMVDVEVTLELMKALRKRREIWNYLMGFFDKGEDQKRTYQLLKAEGRYHGLGVMVSLRWGYNRLYQVPVLFLGPHSVYKNQVVLLRLDMPLAEKSESEILMCAVRKKFGEPGYVLPYRSPYKDKLLEPVQQVVEENLKYLESQKAKIKEACCSQVYDAISGVDLDVGLYQKGFLSSQEMQWSQQFHQALEKNLDGCPTTDLKQQALRYLWRYTDKMPEAFQLEADQSIEAYLRYSVDHRNKPGLRIEEALLQVQKAEQTTSDVDLLSGLQEIRQHIHAISAMLGLINQHTEQK